MGIAKRREFETSTPSDTSGVYARVAGAPEASVETAPAAEPTTLDVGLAPRSASNLYGDFDQKVCGVFVATYALLPVGAPVPLSLHLPGGIECTLRGTVEWQREQATSASECGMGVRLDHPMDVASRELLETFAVWRAPLFFA